MNNSTSVATIENKSVKDVMALTGQSSGDEFVLPFSYLSVNRDADDADGNTLPVGTFKLASNTLGNIYAKSVSFRPFMNTFRYSKYDAELEKTVSRTVFFKSFSEKEIPDSAGGMKCGKVTGKAKNDLSDVEVVEQKAIKCHRHLFGVVTMTGVDKDGKEFTVENHPVAMKLGGVNFMPIGEAMDALTKKKLLMFNHEFNLSLKRDKNGATVFYHIIPEVDYTKRVDFTDSDMDVLNTFLSHVEHENTKILDAWSKARGLQPGVQEAEYEEVAQDVLGETYTDSNFDKA